VIYAACVPFGGSHPWLFIKSFGCQFVMTCIAFSIFFFRLKWRHYWPYFIVALAVAGLGIMLHLPMILSFCCAMLLFWRLYCALTGETAENLWMVYLATCAVIFFYLILFGLFNRHFLYESGFFLVFLCQTALAVSLHFIRTIKDGRVIKKLAGSYGLTLTGLIAAAGLLALIVPTLFKALTYLVGVAAYGLFNAVQAIGRLILSKRGDRINKAWEKVQQARKDNYEARHQWQDTIHHWSFPTFWIAFFLVVIVSAVIFISLRKYWSIDQRKINEGTVTQAPHTSQWQPPVGAESRKRRRKPPKDRVRLEMYRLERKLGQTDEGRNANETVSEWLSRLPLEQTEKTLIRTIYERVRYGKKVVKEEDFASYKRAVLSLADRIRKSKK